VKPKRPAGHLHILGIKYRFGLADDDKSKAQQQRTQTPPVMDYLAGKQLFEIRGGRLNNNQQNMRTVVYDIDNRLNLKIIQKTAQLQVINLTNMC
jgi:hypothetical protein